MTEKLERLESRRFGLTKAPRKSIAESDTTPSSRHIPAAVKRAVRERDGNQCTFEDQTGRRCTERERLEFHHVKPFGRGGDRTLENIRLACRAHNGYLAERDFGKEWMERYRRSRSRVSEPLAVYAVGNRTLPCEKWRRRGGLTSLAAVTSGRARPPGTDHFRQASPERPTTMSRATPQSY